MCTHTNCLVIHSCRACVRACVRACPGACEREGKRKGGREGGGRERARERLCVCTSVYVRVREFEVRGRWGGMVEKDERDVGG